jgi:hypothetical protein
VPSADSILEGLSQVANGAVEVSIGWHVVVALTAAAFLLGVRPQKRSAATALSIPVASVGVVSLAFGNPFNGAVFSLLAIGLALLSRRAPDGHVALASNRWVALGSALIVFGLVYPHFLDGAPYEYLYAAPVGTIPCPTLALVVGAALVADGFGLGAWRLCLAAVACFYGLFGAVRLGVLIDLVLLCGAVGLVVQHRNLRIADLNLVH